PPPLMLWLLRLIAGGCKMKQQQQQKKQHGRQQQRQRRMRAGGPNRCRRPLKPLCKDAPTLQRHQQVGGGGAGGHPGEMQLADSASHAADCQRPPGRRRWKRLAAEAAEARVLSRQKGCQQTRGQVEHQRPASPANLRTSATSKSTGSPWRQEVQQELPVLQQGAAAQLGQPATQADRIEYLVREVVARAPSPCSISLRQLESNRHRSLFLCTSSRHWSLRDSVNSSENGAQVAQEVAPRVKGLAKKPQISSFNSVTKHRLYNLQMDSCRLSVPGSRQEGGRNRARKQTFTLDPPEPPTDEDFKAIVAEQSSAGEWQRGCGIAGEQPIPESNTRNQSSPPSNAQISEPELNGQTVTQQLPDDPSSSDSPAVTNGNQKCSSPDREPAIQADGTGAAADQQAEKPEPAQSAAVAATSKVSGRTASTSSAVKAVAEAKKAAAATAPRRPSAVAATSAASRRPSAAGGGKNQTGAAPAAQAKSRTTTSLASKSTTGARAPPPVKSAASSASSAGRAGPAAKAASAAKTTLTTAGGAAAAKAAKTGAAPTAAAKTKSTASAAAAQQRKPSTAASNVAARGRPSHPAAASTAGRSAAAATSSGGSGRSSPLRPAAAQQQLQQLQQQQQEQQQQLEQKQQQLEQLEQQQAEQRQQLEEKQQQLEQLEQQRQELLAAQQELEGSLAKERLERAAEVEEMQREAGRLGDSLVSSGRRLEAVGAEASRMGLGLQAVTIAMATQLEQSESRELRLLERLASIREQLAETSDQLTLMQAANTQLELEAEQLRERAQSEALAASAALAAAEADAAAIREAAAQAADAAEAAVAAASEEAERRLSAAHRGELDKIRESHERQATAPANSNFQLESLRKEHEAAIEKKEAQFRRELETLEEQDSRHLLELERHHEARISDMSRRFEEMKASLSEKLVVMQSECNELRSRERWREDAIEREAAIKLQLLTLTNSAAGRQNRQDSLEDAEDSGSRDAVRMATVAISAYKDLPDEIDSLKTVLELKQREIADLRSEKAELQEKLGSLAD
uniref:Microtubule associated tumor suppressor candidate 2 n=1 Tax=Macrostomum lignano TaxID=282301 RepID=A0A1I8IHQ0_9PLAT